MGNPFRNLRLMGRKIGRSMLRMSKREKVRRRKAEHYFGKETEIFENPGRTERVISEETDRNLSTGDHEEDVWDIEKEDIF